MKSLAKNFSVSIPVKPYVKQFLEISYGSPINFTGDPQSHKYFRELLSKPNHVLDYKYKDPYLTYSTTVEIMISDHDFYHYGWELSATDIVSFGKRFEERAKLSMRTYVGTFHCVGLPFKMSIHRFQDRFGFTEDTWSYESIKKDFYRNGVVDEIDFEADILLKIENIILRGLSVLGTNCIDKINEHEST